MGLILVANIEHHGGMISNRLMKAWLNGVLRFMTKSTFVLVCCMGGLWLKTNSYGL